MDIDNLIVRINQIYISDVNDIDIQDDDDCRPRETDIITVRHIYKVSDSDSDSEDEFDSISYSSTNGSPYIQYANMIDGKTYVLELSHGIYGNDAGYQVVLSDVTAGDNRPITLWMSWIKKEINTTRILRLVTEFFSGEYCDCSS